jgi:DNA-binding transcriptional MerR regulator
MSDHARIKSPHAFRTITEAAEDIGVPAHVLRFWEGRFPALRPMKRAGGRRLYRVDDMALVRGLKTLLHDDGYTIKGVQKLLKDNGVAWVRDAGQAARDAAEPGLGQAEPAPWQPRSVYGAGLGDSADARCSDDRIDADGCQTGPVALPPESARAPATDAGALRSALARLQAANRRIERVLAA